MASYAVNTIINDILKLLDEHNISDSLLADEDTYSFSVRDMVNGRLLDAVKQVVSRAPAAVIHTTECKNLPENTAITWEASRTGVGSLTLPDDFFRLVVFKMSDWKRPVFEMLSVTDEDYAMQSSDCAGIRGNVYNPVCVVSGNTLEFYSSLTSSATISKALYLPYPSVENVTENGVQTENIDIPKRCYDSVVYTTAALVCLALEKTQLGNTLNELSKSSMV